MPRHIHAADAMAYRRHTPRFEDVVLVLAATIVLAACGLVWGTSPPPVRGLGPAKVPSWGGLTPMVLMFAGVTLGVLSVIVRGIRGDRR